MDGFPRIAAALILAAVLALAGCGSWLPPLGSTKAKPEDSEFVNVLSSVALDPVSGPPKAISDRLVRMLDEESRRANIALLNYEGGAGDYRLHGDLKITRRKNIVKVSYDWRLTDRNGALAGRSAGAESIAAPGTDTDLWPEVPDATLRHIAEQGTAVVVNRR